MIDYESCTHVQKALTTVSCGVHASITRVYKPMIQQAAHLRGRHRTHAKGLP